MTMCRCACWWSGLLALLIGSAAAQAQTTQPATGPADAPPPAEQQVEFISEKYGFKLMFPDWLRRLDSSQPPGVALMLLRVRPDPGGTQAQIMVVSPPDIRAGLGLEESARVYVETFQRAFSDLRVLDKQQGTLDGRPATVYTMQGHQLQGGREVKLQMVIALHGERLYSLIALAEPAGFDTLKRTFDGVVESFRWTK